MNNRPEFPETHSLKDRDGRDYQLLVDTNTNDWRFKVVRGGVTAAEAAGVLEGEVFVLKQLDVRNREQVQAGWWSSALRSLTGGNLEETGFRKIGVGTSLLQFICHRARAFVASEVVMLLNTSNVEDIADVTGWFQRRDFRFEPMPDGSTLLRGRLRLIWESSEPVTVDQIAKSRKVGKVSNEGARKVNKVAKPTKRKRQPLSKPEGGSAAGAFSKEPLAKLLRPVSDMINGKLADVDELLDPSVRERLRASNTFMHHGGDTRVLQYHIWDRDQPSIFHRHHFKYEVQYDPAGTKAGTATTNFCIHFYLNKIRLYHEREAMVKRVRRELEQIRLTGFKLKETERAFSFHHNFKATSHKELILEVRKYLFPLLNQVHPMFSRIMDAFNVPMTKAERRAIISDREKLLFVDRSSPNYGKNQEFRREVPRHLRTATFRRDGHTCQHCELKFEVSSLHADHVMPIARGGLTTLGNLQTLCGPCNLRKGKRLEAELIKLRLI